MLATWRRLGDRTPTYTARLHTRYLRVEQLPAGAWRWSVSTSWGSELGGGLTTTLTEGEEAAEHELWAVHLEPDWIERQLA
jgi:hypothetical protein